MLTKMSYLNLVGRFIGLNHFKRLVSSAWRGAVLRAHAGALFTVFYTELCDFFFKF